MRGGESSSGETRTRMVGSSIWAGMMTRAGASGPMRRGFWSLTGETSGVLGREAGAMGRVATGVGSEGGWVSWQEMMTRARADARARVAAARLIRDLWFMTVPCGAEVGTGLNWVGTESELGFRIGPAAGHDTL